MAKRVALIMLLSVAIGAAGLAAAQLGPSGYLSPSVFNVLTSVPPAPVTGDARDQADRAIFRETRKLVGTPRYRLATNDVKLSPTDMFADFSCSLGVVLTPEMAPKTAALLSKATFDVARETSIAKDF